MTKASDNAFPSLLITEGTEPSAPAAGKQRLYIDSTSHKLKRTDSSGTDVDIEQAIGAATSFTPTVTGSGGNPTLGSSTISGHYTQLASKLYLIRWRFVITTGGAWAVWTGNLEFSLPAGLTSAAYVQVIYGHILDNGTSHFTCSGTIAASATKTTELYAADGSGSRIVSPTVPMTPATGDIYEFQGILAMT